MYFRITRGMCLQKKIVLLLIIGVAYVFTHSCCGECGESSAEFAFLEVL